MTTRLSTKGQLVLPKELRDRLGWKPGTALEVEAVGSRVVVRRALDFPEVTLDQLIGCARYEGPAKTLEEMEAGIAEGARNFR